MSKLTELLNQQAKLSSEEEALARFLDAFTQSKGTLELHTVGASIRFEDADAAARNNIIALMEEQYLLKSMELDRVNDKLGALEKLV